MNIAVLLNENRESVYIWVDTVVMKDEFERPIAILVDTKTGTVFGRDINTIRVISNDIID
jgi:hypothetical protein